MPMPSPYIYTIPAIGYAFIAVALAWATQDHEWIKYTIPGTTVTKWFSFYQLASMGGTTYGSVASIILLLLTLGTVGMAAYNAFMALFYIVRCPVPEMASGFNAIYNKNSLASLVLGLLLFTMFENIRNNGMLPDNAGKITGHSQSATALLLFYFGSIASMVVPLLSFVIAYKTVHSIQEAIQSQPQSSSTDQIAPTDQVKMKQMGTMGQMKNRFSSRG